MPNQSMGIPFDMFMELYEQNSKYYSVLLGDNGDPAFFILEYVLSAMIGIISYWFKKKLWTHLPNDINIILDSWNKMV